MKVNHVDNIYFGITIKKPVRTNFNNGCHMDTREGKFKDYSIELCDIYRGNKKDSTSIILKKAGIWVKTKIKYNILGERKTIWYYADDKKSPNL